MTIQKSNSWGREKHFLNPPYLGKRLNMKNFSQTESFMSSYAFENKVITEVGFEFS